MPPTPIVVAFDDSPDARRAVEWACAAALETPGTAIHLVHALTLPPIPYPSTEIPVAELLDRHERELRDRLDLAQRELEARGIAVETEVRRWLPVETVLEHAEACSAGLVVVGQRGERTTRLLLGSVSSALARSASQPTVVVRGARTALPPRRILAAIDGSASSLRAATAARRLLPRAELVLVQVRDGGDGTDDSALRAALGSELAGLELRELDGPVAETLLDLLAREPFELVAAGRRGLSAWRELLLGGVSEKIVQLAPCPVLLGT